METGCRIGGCELFTLGNHRENATVDNRRTGIDGYVLGFEDLWEILCQPLADTMMLTLTNSRQVASSLDRSRLKGLNLLEHLFT